MPASSHMKEYEVAESRLTYKYVFISRNQPTDEQIN
jgi:hypothetical protein